MQDAINLTHIYYKLEILYLLKIAETNHIFNRIAFI